MNTTTITKIIDEGGKVDKMSLRDYFAGQALLGILACSHEFHQSIKNDSKCLTQWAYDFADAMVQERKKHG